MKNKEDYGVTINSVEFFIAQERWANFWSGQGIKIHSFGEFLGMHKRTHVSQSTTSFNMMLRKSSVKKIKLLCTPHWYTILKAYQIRKHK